MAGNLTLSYTEKTDLGTTAFTILAQNRARKYLYIINTHASQLVYVKFGAAAESAKGFKIAAGGILEFGKDGGPVPIDYVSLYGSGASTTVQVVEGV